MYAHHTWGRIWCLWFFLLKCTFATSFSSSFNNKNNNSNTRIIYLDSRWCKVITSNSDAWLIYVRKMANLNKMQPETARLHPRCRQQANWVVFDSSPFIPFCENMTSSIKPEVHNILHCCQRRTEPRPQTTCTEYLVKIGRAVLSYASRQTKNRQANTHTRWSQYVAPSKYAHYVSMWHIPCHYIKKKLRAVVVVESPLQGSQLSVLSLYYAADSLRSFISFSVFNTASLGRERPAGL